MNASPTYLLIACEASADLHGSRVIEAMRVQQPDARFVGIGGEACRAAGMELLAHARELGLMGFSDVLWALPRVLGILRRVARVPRQRRIAAALLIDAPDFNLRLAPRLKHAGLPLVYFISPKIWATRPGRVRAIHRWIDRMLVIFPFEVDLYRQAGVEVEYVGNPVVEQMRNAASRDEARAQLGLKSDDRIVAMLPGSRRGEIDRIAPTLGRVAQDLLAQDRCRVFVPRAPTVDEDLLRARLGAVDGIEIIDGQGREVLAAADAAIIAAGTATLEAALAGVPALMVYRVSWFSALIYRFILKIPYISLINIIAGRFVIKELWQKALTAPAVLAELRRLLSGKDRQHMLAAYQEIRDELGQHNTAARVAEVLRSMGSERRGD